MFHRNYGVLLFGLLVLASSNLYATQAKQLARATFSMYCYWTGEATLGKIPGVKQTKIGSLDHQEVVEVLYDPKITNPGEMTQALKRQKSFYSLLHRTPAEKTAALAHLSKSDIKAGSKNISYIAAKHSLKVTHPMIYQLNLTEAQAIKLNSWAHFDKGPMPDVLSAKQKQKLGKK